jgi:hypothetical protein
MARLVAVAALVAAIGWASSTAAAAKTPLPTIAGYSAVPSTVTGPGGYVHLSVTPTRSTSCTFATTAVGATLTPATVPCSSGKVTSTLFVAEDYGRLPAKVHVKLTVTGPGGTKSATITVLVDPGEGGRSVPGAPAAIAATASDGSAAVTVTPPASTGGAPVESYTVTAIDLTTATNGGQTASGSSGQLTVTGLTDGDTYEFVATATNAIGTGPESGNSNEVIPEPEVIPPPVPGVPTAVTAAVGDQQATVSFVPPANASAGVTYRVAATDVTASANGGQNASGSTSPLTVTGLTDGDTYEFAVQATNSSGSGPLSQYSNQVIPDPEPGTPTEVSAVAGQQQATVSFVPTVNASADTTYLVAATDVTNSANGGQTTSGRASPLTVTGLTDGDTYVFTVQTTNARGSSPLSGISNQVVPYSVPGTPTEVSAVGGDQQAIVWFVPPANAGPLTSYTVVASDQTNPANGRQTVVGDSPVTVAELTGGDTYTFTVTAVNGSIEGPPSLPSNSVVPTVGNQPGAAQAVEAGQNAYMTVVNADPNLAQCNTSNAGSGICAGIELGTWQLVDGSDAEYYAFGNPQPTLDPTTHALDHLTVQIIGAALDPSATNGYDFQQETITVNPANGFLDRLWWSNLESFSPSGNYSGCNFNWKLDYNTDNNDGGCEPIYFGPADYLFGPVFSNDSIFVTGDGTVTGSPSFGTAASPSAVQTADPNCLFVDDTSGMSGSDANCAAANSEVAVYDSTNSSYEDPAETSPQSDSQLATVAADDGCLYSGPTQIALSTAVVNGQSVGQMTVTSPDTTESAASDNGTPVTWDNNNSATNYNNCPDSGTADLPANGVVYVENATSGETVNGANPFDDLLANTVTNLTSSPVTPTAGNAVTLTATVTSSAGQISSGANVAFSQTTSTTVSGVTTTTTSVIAACSSVADWSNPVQVGNNWQSTATCSTTEATNGTGAFSAIYSGGTTTDTSRGNLGQTNTLSPGMTYGAESQTNAGGCTGCYYGESAMPDAEGDAFVNGSLSGELTIGTQNDVIIDGNVTYADCSGTWTTGQSGERDFCPYSAAGPNDSLGLIADNYVEVNHPMADGADSAVQASCDGTPGALCDAATPTGSSSDGAAGLTIDAAILALTGSFAVNNFAIGSVEGQLDIYGSVQQFARGPVSTSTGDTDLSGYVKHYTWDPLLDFLAPPDYLSPSTPSWVLSAVTPADGSTNVCPPLLGVFAGTNAEGVIQDGPAVTEYCATPSGGLPDYPLITAPSPPAGVSGTAAGPSDVSLSWAAPVWNGGSPVTDYVVTPYLDGTIAQVPLLFASSATSEAVTGLDPDTDYSFEVAAVNSQGTSANSSASAIIGS